MDTNILLTNWHAYCSGSDEFDECDFLTLLHDDPRLTLEQLIDAFQYFDNGDTIANTVFAAQGIRFDKKYLPITKDKAENFARQHLTDILDKIDDSLDEWLDKALVSNAPIRITTDDEPFNTLFYSDENIGSVPDSEYSAYLGEAIPAGSFNDQLYGLKESLFGFTTNLLLPYHFLEPAIKFDCNLGNYYRLWQSGVMYALTENELVLYTKPHSKVS